jgi:hypothetical protein
MDSHDGVTIYATTIFGQVIKSADAGATWEALTPSYTTFFSISEAQIFVHPTQGLPVLVYKRPYTGSCNGVNYLFSTDGRNFNSSNQFSYGYEQKAAVSVTNPNILYAIGLGTSTSCEVSKSLDAGVTFPSSVQPGMQLFTSVVATNAIDSWSV